MDVSGVVGANLEDVVNHKDKALRLAFKAFRMMSMGTKFSAEDCGTLADICGIALPMRYRFTRAELDSISEESLSEKAVTQ